MHYISIENIKFFINQFGENLIIFFIIYRFYQDAIKLISRLMHLPIHYLLKKTDIICHFTLNLWICLIYDNEELNMAMDYEGEESVYYAFEL